MAVAVAFGNHDELQSLVHAAPVTAPWVCFRGDLGCHFLIYWVVVNHRFFKCSPRKLGKMNPFLTTIFFQMGWNHQLVYDRQQQATGTSKYWTHWCGTFFFVCVWTHWFFNGINAYYTYSCTFLLPTGYSSLRFLVEACISQEVFPEHDSTQIHELSGTSLRNWTAKQHRSAASAWENNTVYRFWFGLAHVPFLLYLEGPVENDSLEDKENILKYFDCSFSC